MIIFLFFSFFLQNSFLQEEENFLNRKLVAFYPFRSHMCPNGPHARETQPVLHNWTQSGEKILERLWDLMMSPMAAC
jgi:hypothetical protein